MAYKQNKPFNDKFDRRDSKGGKSERGERKYDDRKGSRGGKFEGRDNKFSKDSRDNRGGRKFDRNDRNDRRNAKGDFRKAAPKKDFVKKDFVREERRDDFDGDNFNSESYEQYNKVFGRNAVREALKADRNINKLYIAKGETDHTLTLIVAMAKDRGINISYTDRRKLDFFTNNGNHQGVVAVCSPVEFVSVEDILYEARKKGEKAFIVMLDGITDPHNAGAIIRSAYCAGAHGIIISKRRSALISEGVFKSSAGSVEYLPIAQVANLNQTIDLLKNKGLFAVCCDMDGTNYTEIDYDMPLLLIIGAEGEGVGRLVKEKCDFVATIPIKGNIDSLNASVAAGIVMFEAVKYRK